MTKSILVYAFTDLINAQVAVLALLFGLPFAVALALGTRAFHRTSDLLYRRLAYAIIGVSALISLPVFDRLH